MSWMRRLILQTGKTLLRMGECVCDVRYLFSSNNLAKSAALAEVCAPLNHIVTAVSLEHLRASTARQLHVVTTVGTRPGE